MRIDIDTFKKQMKEGVWVLAEASEPMQLFVKRNFPENYDEEIRKYRTPQKYIKVGQKIVVVSISEQVWAGIDCYEMPDMIIREIGGYISVLRNPKRAERMVNAVERDLDESFWRDMLATGYVTQEECDKYRNPDCQKDMTLIKTITF